MWLPLGCGESGYPVQWPVGVLFIYMEKPESPVWKISWLAPFRLGRLRIRGQWFEAMQFSALRSLFSWFIYIFSRPFCQLVKFYSCVFNEKSTRYISTSVVMVRTQGYVLNLVWTGFVSFFFLSCKTFTASSIIVLLSNLPNCLIIGDKDVFFLKCSIFCLVVFCLSKWKSSIKILKTYHCAAIVWWFLCISSHFFCCLDNVFC